jgi:hypothetical protein
MRVLTWTSLAAPTLTSKRVRKHTPGFARHFVRLKIKNPIVCQDRLGTSTRNNNMLNKAAHRFAKTEVKAGRVNISDLDRAVSNVLRVKFATGLFDRPANVTMRTPEELDTPAFRQVVREAAEQVRQRVSGFLRPLLRY